MFLIDLINDSLEQTTLAGHVRRELNCLPVENKEYRQVLEERTRQAMKPKAKTQYLHGDVQAHGISEPGTIGLTDSFGTFIVRITSILFIFTFLLRFSENHWQQTAGKAVRTESYPHAAERAPGSYLRLLPEIQLLVLEESESRAPSA